MGTAALAGRLLWPPSVRCRGLYRDCGWLALSPIAYLCSTARCHRLLSRPGRCALHHEQERQRKRTKLRVQGTDAPHWVKLRRMVRVRDGHRCTNCGTTESLSVHLDPSLGGNHFIATVDDAWTLCKSCHGRIDQPRSVRA